MTSAGIEEFILAVFDQIIGHRPRKSKQDTRPVKSGD
jgi:hypothetical protein